MSNSLRGENPKLNASDHNAVPAIAVVFNGNQPRNIDITGVSIAHEK
ncbi:hypothetical protein L1F28_04355 [Arthrospira platensis NCB002]|nr:hypothetical protein [Arthrospira platensis NCB002]